MRVSLVISLVVMCFAVLVPPPPATAARPAAALLAGGSNYDFYALDGCDREPYGVVDSFDRAPDVVRGQLAQMHAAGQRRLRVGIFHQHGPDSGTTMDSSGADLSAADRAQLAELLAAVRDAGFEQVEIVFMPIGQDDPHGWSSWSEDSYQEDWGVVRNLRPIIVAAGLPYLIDLLNEGMPMSNQPVLRQYATRLWADYTANFGAADTVGFSMTTWIADRATQMAAVYGANPPDVFEVHLYGDSWNGDEYTQFVDADKKMTELGYRQDWIVGETYFDDQTAADGIRRAIGDTGRVVRFVTQWPLTRSQACPDVDQAPPVRYDAFHADGF